MSVWHCHTYQCDYNNHQYNVFDFETMQEGNE